MYVQQSSYVRIRDGKKTTRKREGKSTGRSRDGTSGDKEE